MPQRLNDEGTKWRVQVRAGQQRPSEVVYGTHAEAVQREAELRARVGRLSMEAAGDLTLAEYLPRWLETQRAAVTPSTYERYDILIRCQILPLVGARPITRLEPGEIRDAYAQLAAQGLASGTIRYAHNVLRAALEDAVEEHRMQSNPASARMIAKWLRGYRKTNPPADLAPPPLKDVQALLARMLTTPSGRRLYGPCLTALDTGLRLGEVLALKWEDVDTESGTLMVRRAFQETNKLGLLVKKPKSEKSTRPVLLTRRLAAYLERHRAMLDEMAAKFGPQDWAAEDWVFPNTTVHSDHKPGRPWMPRTYMLLMRRETLRLGLPLNTHTLRRLHATVLEHAKVPRTEIAHRLGQSGTKVTERHYLFTVRDGQRDAVARFEQALAESDAG